MLNGKKISLRPLEFEDYQLIVNWHNDTNIKYLTMMHPFPVPQASEKEWIENIITNKSNLQVYFGIELLETNALVGIICLKPINYLHNNAKVGIFIGDASYRSRGIGMEAMQLVLEYGFKQLNLIKINLEVIESNIAAIKLFDKMGFIKEGILKKQFFFNDKYFDVLLMSYFK